jgi:hypothetical protein
MEQKEYEAYIEHQIASLNSQYKMAIVQNKNWQDLLLESIKDDKDFDEVYKTFLSKLEKSNSINISNPEKLARDYALLSGDSIKILYIGENKTSYVYTYRVRTKPNIAGEMFIIKDKLDGRVCIEFERQIGGSESRVYEMDEFTDFQTFMGLIIDVISKFR